ncbi:hypothetical protein GQ42DRAFT_5398, partial [Ramicandelaber brevisporus]
RCTLHTAHCALRSKLLCSHSYIHTHTFDTIIHTPFRFDMQQTLQPSAISLYSEHNPRGGKLVITPPGCDHNGYPRDSSQPQQEPELFVGYIGITPVRLRGLVHINYNDFNPVKAKCLDIRFYGEQKVRFNDDSRIRATKQFATVEHELWREQAFPYKAIRTESFPFDIELPTGLISTMKHDKYGEVTYKLEATLLKENEFGVRPKRIVSIALPIVDYSMALARAQQAEPERPVMLPLPIEHSQSTFVWSCTVGPHTVLAPGDRMWVNLRMSGCQPGFEPTSVTFGIKRYVEIYEKNCKSRRHHRKKYVAETSGKAIKEVESQAINSIYSVYLDLHCPDAEMPTVNGDLIKVSFKAKVKVGLRYAHSVEAETPITILPVSDEQLRTVCRHAGVNLPLRRADSTMSRPPYYSAMAATTTTTTTTATGSMIGTIGTTRTSTSSDESSPTPSAPRESFAAPPAYSAMEAKLSKQLD